MIRFSVQDREGIFTVAVQGHAGYAPRGQDIVCAAASALVNAAALGAEALWERGALKMPPEIRLREGRGKIAVAPAPGREREAEAWFMTIAPGLMALEGSYPEYLENTERMRR